jgi:hypothetical protein
VVKKTAVNSRLRARAADAERAIQQRRAKAWKHRALQAEVARDFEKKSRDEWQERAEDAEQMSRERLGRLEELNGQLKTKELQLANAEETMREQAAEIEFWVEQSDHFRNEVVRLRRWQAKAEVAPRG